MMYVIRKLSSLVVLVAGLLACTSPAREQNKEAEVVQEIRLQDINLPDGFKIALYARVPNARSMVLSERGTLFVGNRSEDKVYAVQDTDGDYRADKIYVIDEGLSMPNGVALKDGDLYVAAISTIYRYADIEEHLADPPAREVVFDGYPTDRHHGWKYIAFGPDGMLYVPVGAPCNICLREDNPLYASITRLDVQHPGQPELIAHGVRNTVGFDWDPLSGRLWFTDNGRDMMGDDVPPCELNIVAREGQHYGYPFCHGGDIPDPEFGRGHDCADYVPPVVRFAAHVAPLGMVFYRGEMFPTSYRKTIFVAQHGSWNRSRKIGYRIVAVHYEPDGRATHEVFADGWLNDDTQKAWGRPVDVINMPDGSILVSDDYADAIYRIWYEG